MDYINRFYGVYEGVVVDSNDPENRGRVKLTVPQVTGSAETEWASAITGGIAQNHYPYGTFSSNADQTVTGANLATVVNFTRTEDANKTQLINGTKLQVQETGDYIFQFSAQLSKTGSNAAQADIWIRKNGVDYPRTNSRTTFAGNPNETLTTVMLIIDLEIDDYIEVVFSSAEAGTKITAHNNLTTPVRPDIPGIIATLSLIGKYKPQPGAKVGVMYLAGDPNFPLWIGEIA